MKRRTFDTLVSSVGALLTAVLLIAGVGLFWGYSFANGEVQEQLTAQQIVFPQADDPQMEDPAIGPYIRQYAGEQLTTGAQAKAYADHYIGAHLVGIAGGKTYSQMSAESRANPEDAGLRAQVDALFRGEVLRGVLLTAYAFWQFGQFALYGSIAAMALAVVMAALTVLGFRHARHVPETEELGRLSSRATPVPA